MLLVLSKSGGAAAPPFLLPITQTTKINVFILHWNFFISMKFSSTKAVEIDQYLPQLGPICRHSKHNVFVVSSLEHFLLYLIPEDINSITMCSWDWYPIFSNILFFIFTCWRIAFWTTISFIVIIIRAWAFFWRSPKRYKPKLLHVSDLFLWYTIL